MPDRYPIQPGDALLIVDLQNDFLPGGALGVQGGDAIIPIAKLCVREFEKRGLTVVFSRDWHPAGHCSFRDQGGPWPDHCVAGTKGAEFGSGVEVPASAIIVSKAAALEKDAYSAFEDTGLHERLRERGIRRLFIGGLATDYCVLNTVRDALDLGYSVFVLEDAIRAVNVQPDDGYNAIQEMTGKGASLIRAGNIDFD